MIGLDLNFDFTFLYLSVCIIWILGFLAAECWLEATREANLEALQAHTVKWLVWIIKFLTI